MRHRTTVPIRFAFAFAMACILYLGCAGSGNAKGGADVVSAPSVLPGEKPSLRGAIPPHSGPGKSLVVYFTQGSATQWVAEDLAELFQADLEPILERTPRKTSFMGFMTSGFQATFGFASPIEPQRFDPAVYDRVFVLTPVWSWGLSPPVRTWLKANRGKLPKAAFASISGDTKPDRIVRAMTKVSGTKPVAFTGFGEKDFLPANRAVYLEKLGVLADAMR